MQGIFTVFGLAALVLAPPALAQQAPAGGQIVGQWTRPDGFQQITLITPAVALGYAVPGDWKALQFDFKLPVATAVYEVPDPSALDGTSNTNCSMAFADPATPEGQAVINRAAAFGAADSPRDGWTLRTQTDAAPGAAPTLEKVASKVEGHITVVAMCAWPKGATHDATYDAYMTRIFNSLLDSVAAPATPFKARPGEQFFSQP